MKSLTLIIVTTLSFLSFSASAKVHTTALEIADVVTSIDSLNKKIVGLTSISLQKFNVSKIDVTKAISHDEIGLCVYEYTAYLSNVDSQVREALKGEDFFTGKQNVKGKCQF